MELQIENYKDKHEYISENGIRSVVYLMDCIEGLKQIPEKYFELAIVVRVKAVHLEHAADHNAARAVDTNHPTIS